MIELTLFIFLKIWTILGLTIFLVLSTTNKIKNKGWDFALHGITWAFLWPLGLYIKFKDSNEQTTQTKSPPPTSKPTPLPGKNIKEGVQPPKPKSNKQKFDKKRKPNKKRTKRRPKKMHRRPN